MNADPAVRIACTEALSVLEMTEAQQAIVALAGDVVASEPVRIAAMHALAASVRRFGNDLTDDQAAVIIAIVAGQDSHALREAAAQVLGALNLPSDQVRPLILQAESAD